MDPLHWQRLKVAFEQYYEGDVATRNALLSQLGKDDPALAQALMELVQADESVRRKEWWPIGREAGRAEDFRGNSRFTLQERLGVGGFGAVYRAYDTHAERVVALKILRVNEPRLLHAFKREFRVVANLRHPNLVKVHELFVERDHAYFAMELVDGVKITDSVRAQLPDLRDARFVVLVREAFRQLCHGLSSLHRVGIVHRDLKPSNVLRTSVGRVVILDFGQVTVGSKPVQPLGGTPAYRAPELSEGIDGGALGDWYAAGLILFEMLVGSLPEPAPGRVSAELVRSSVGWMPDAESERGLANLATLCEELLRRSPESRPSEARILSLLSELGNDSRGEPSSAQLMQHDDWGRDLKLFGRERHLMALFQQSERAARGTFVISRVVGHSGMGKTVLVQEFLRHLVATRPESVVLQGRCHERESLGFRVFDGIIDELAVLIQRESPAFVREIVPEHAAELVLLFPALREVLSAVTPVVPASPHEASASEQRRLAFAALLKILSNLARRRFLVIFADDLQWADEDSRQLLRYLLQSSSSLPLLWIVAYRNDQEDAVALAREVTRVSSRERLQEISVDSLEPEESRAMLEDALGQNHPMARIPLGAQDGAPFLLNLLVDEARGMQLDGSVRFAIQDLDSLLALRIARLQPDARRFMALLTVAVQPMRREWVYRALGLSWATATDIEDLLRIRRMLRTVGQDCLEPFHDRLRTAFLSTLSASEKTRLHTTLVGALEAVGDPELLAYHCFEAGFRDRGVRYSWMAARKCAGAFAFDRAITHYRRVLALATSDEGSLLAELADVLVSAGKGHEAAQCYLQAAHLVPERRSDLRLLAGQQLIQSGEIEGGRELLREILVAAHVLVPQSRLVLTAALVVKRVSLRNRLRGVVTPVRESEPGALRVLEALWALASSLALVDTIGAAYYEALFFGYALERGDSRSLARALSLEAIYSSIEGGAAKRRVDPLISALERACERSGELDTRALLDVAKSVIAWMGGDFEECLRYALSAEGLLARHGRGLAFEFGAIRAFALASCIWLGKFAEHRDRFEMLRADARERSDLQTETNLVLLAHAHVSWLIRDEPDVAEAEIDSVVQRWPIRHGLTLQHLWAVFSKVEIALYRGDGEAAREMLEARWSEILRSGHMQIAPIRIWFRQLKLRTRFASVMARPTRRPSRHELRRIRREVEQLGREELPLGRALAALTRGMLHFLGEDKAAAWLDFDDAVGRFEALGMRLFVYASRWARHAAEPNGDSSKRLLIRMAMSGLGVVAPVSTLRLLVPVIPAPTEAISASDPLARIVARGAGSSAWDDPTTCDTTLNSA
jgi:serine/threonine protein kinase/transposase-like protein